MFDARSYAFGTLTSSHALYNDIATTLVHGFSFRNIEQAEQFSYRDTLSLTMSQTESPGEEVIYGGLEMVDVSIA